VNEWQRRFFEQAMRDGPVDFTYPRGHGKAIVLRVVSDMELLAGGHVHTANYSYDETCQGGDPECWLWNQQLEEAREAWQ